jgi:hypothetical protein
MTKWEYARLQSQETGLNVVFTHRPAWTGLAPEAFFETLRRLGDEGWELVAAIPLAADAAYEYAPEPAPGHEERSRDERERWPDGRDGRSPTAAAAAAHAARGPQRMTLQVGTDRWLMFKRPQPEPPSKPSGPVGMLKELAPIPPVLKRLPL